MFKMTSKRIFIFMGRVAACGMISAAYGQMFDAKPAEKIVPGINKIPPLLPVLTPGDFQGKVKSMSEETRSSMMKQGLDTIQQQRDDLPSQKPGEPPALTPATPSEADKDKTEASDADASVPPPSQHEEPANPLPPAAPENAPQAETSTIPDSGLPQSTPPSTGGLNIQY